MAEIPKLIEFGDDQNKGSLDTTEMSDSFIVDIENLSHGTMKDIAANSRISVKMQRNLSRKGGERNKTTLALSGVTNGSSNGKTAATLTAEDCKFDKTTPAPPMVSLGTKEAINKQSQQTITITAENRCSSGRRYLKQRTSSFFDPRRVLLLFATLSSMGTILLILLTLSTSKFSGDNYIQDQ